MLAKILTCAIVGLEGAIVEVEVDISPGQFGLTLVGLPDASVQEAKERVRAAIRNSGCVFPFRRITVNLAPADLKKEGPAYDLPMAVGLLACSGQVELDGEPTLFLGELSLDGTLRHTHGILPMVALAREKGIKTVYVPKVDALEAALVEGVTVIPVGTLAELVGHLRGEAELPVQPTGRPVPSADGLYEGADFGDVMGQEYTQNSAGRGALRAA